MGVAISKNTAEAIASVSNEVDSSTVVDQSQESFQTQRVNIGNCQIEIGKNFNVDFLVKNTFQTKQIVQAKNQSTFTNNIAQSLTQQATSKVGALGLGYADASNVASAVAKTTNLVTNSIVATSEQFNNTFQSFNCENGGRIIVGGDFNLGFKNTGDFLADALVKNDTTATISNSIQQQISQKASAEVSGIGGLILLLLVFVGVYFLTKKKSSSSGETSSSGWQFNGKSFVLGLSAIGLITGLMYWLNAPPFFNETPICNVAAPAFGCSAPCADAKPLRDVTLNLPPLRYLFGIYEPKQGLDANLLQMVIARATLHNATKYPVPNRNNAGYNYSTFIVLEQYLLDINNNRPTDVTKEVPNPLHIPHSPNGKYYRIPTSFKTIRDSDDSSVAGSLALGACLPVIIMGVDPSQQPVFSGKCTDFELKNILSSNQLVEFSGDPSEDILALYNLQAWKDFCSASDANASYGRFILCKYLEIDCTNAWNMGDAVIVNDRVTTLSKDEGYQMKPLGPCNNIDGMGLNYGAIVTGEFGFCDTKSYRIQKFFKSWGKFVIIAMIVVLLLILSIARK